MVAKTVYNYLMSLLLKILKQLMAQSRKAKKMLFFFTYSIITHRFTLVKSCNCLHSYHALYSDKNNVVFAYIRN